MCGNMADIQSAAAEIRRGKKRRRKKKEERRTNHSMKIYMVSLFHRATINKGSLCSLLILQAARIGRVKRELGTGKQSTSL